MVSLSYLRRSSPVLKSFAYALLPRKKMKKVNKAPIVGTVPGPKKDHVEEFLHFVGNNFDGNHLPLSMFPQWCIPFCMQGLEGYPFQLIKVINAGCQLEFKKEIFLGEEMFVRTEVLSVDDNGKRSLVTQKLEIGSSASKEVALNVTMFYRFPSLSKKGSGKKTEREEQIVFEEKDRMTTFTFSESTAQDYAILTGDVNPIHWLKPYAKLSGFSSTILHGFATMALVLAELERQHSKCKTFSIKFTGPVLLPSHPKLYYKNNHWALGESSTGPFFAVGKITFEKDSV